ncbi:MAG: methylated-DNA--[protein]-cysteine S-methyltransferase [Kiritimatiellae bacterium]|nr:methylated-DNA--[protein]-cysteine S-methyltransferase [Kiritimatiellia bacterium]
MRICDHAVLGRRCIIPPDAPSPAHIGRFAMKREDVSHRTKIPVPPWGALTLEWRRERGRVRVTRVILPGWISAEARQRTTAAIPELRPIIAGLRAAMRGAPAKFPRDVLDWSRCSEFQRATLRRLARVTRGRVITYRQLAEAIGRPRAARAVARALATNPFPLILPCHRIVRADGSTGGYQGGQRLKQSLLHMEHAHVAKGRP